MTKFLSFYLLKKNKKQKKPLVNELYPFLEKQKGALLHLGSPLKWIWIDLGKPNVVASQTLFSPWEDHTVSLPILSHLKGHCYRFD